MIKAEIPFKAHIILDQKNVQFLGPKTLSEKIFAQKKQFGADPQKWQKVNVTDSYDVLLNEFILRCQNQYKIPYEHEELCHCRMVATEKVINAIKQGQFSVSEVSRVTMAGTGCGSCKKDIDDLLNYLLK